MTAALRKRERANLSRRDAMASVGALALASGAFDAVPARAIAEASSELSVLIDEHKATEAQMSALSDQIYPLEMALYASLRSNPVIVVLGPRADQTLNFTTPGISRTKAIHDATRYSLVELLATRGDTKSLSEQIACVMDTEGHNFQLVEAAEQALLDRMGTELRELMERYDGLAKVADELFGRIRKSRPQTFAEVRAYIDYLRSDACYGDLGCPGDDEMEDIFAALSTSGVRADEAAE